MTQEKAVRPHGEDHDRARPLEDSEMEQVVGGTDADSGLDSAGMEPEENDGAAPARDPLTFFGD